MAFIYCNENPSGRHTVDCTVRAISKIMRQKWEKTYTQLCLQGYKMHSMPSANAVWSRFLINNGFKRHLMPDFCPECYTIDDFCRDHPQGEYIVATGEHVVAVIDGDIYDTWDSGGEIVDSYFERSF